MGQIEIYEWLKKQRLMGFDQFYTPKEIVAGLKAEGLNYGLTRVSLQASRLAASGYLEVKFDTRISEWRRTYRLKRKYVKYHNKESAESACTA